MLSVSLRLLGSFVMMSNLGVFWSLLKSLILAVMRSFSVFPGRISLFVSESCMPVVKSCRRCISSVSAPLL